MTNIVDNLDDTSLESGSNRSHGCESGENAFGNNALFSRNLHALRRNLLETGARNRLIHFNRANKRAKVLHVINERSDAIYQLLRIEGKRMRFKAMGRDKAESPQELLLASSDPTLPVSAERYTDNFIETPLGPEALARRLLGLSRDAKTAEEEQGLNILYLAMGFLSWRENTSSKSVREAPLILLPVELVRNQRTSTFDIKSRDDDLAANLPLQERLRQDFGIELPDIDADAREGWTPSHYFAQVREAVSHQREWSIDENGMVIGFFSFAKLLMYHDLDPSNWPDDALCDSKLLSGLLSEGFEADEPLFGPEDRLDDHLDPDNIVHVVDADASQTKVIEEVRRGKSLVVQGPPGTGKSQTITNIIAAAVHDGKSVLFVAEKMAALSVVHDRLKKAGLEDICLELHSHKTNKKAFVQELGRTLNADRVSPSDGAVSEQLRRTRDELNRITALLHAPLSPNDETPFHALSEIAGFIGKGTRPPSIPEDGLEKLSREARAQAFQVISEYVAALEKAGPLDAHPFSGTGALDLQPTELERLKTQLIDANTAISHLRHEAARLARALHQPEPTSLNEIVMLHDGFERLALAPEGAEAAVELLFAHAGQERLREALEAGVAWSQAHVAAADKFTFAAWAMSLDALSMLRRVIQRGQNSFFSRLSRSYRHASRELAGLLSGPLPNAPAERLALLDELVEVQSRRKRLSEDEGWLQSILGAEWRGERTDFASLRSISAWLAEIKRSGAFAQATHVVNALNAFSDPCGSARALEECVRDCRSRLEKLFATLEFDVEQAGVGASLDAADLSRLEERLGNMAGNTARYHDWVELQRSIRKVENTGAGGIVDAVAEGRLNPKDAVQEFAYACAEARWNTARSKHPELNELRDIDRHSLVHHFQKLEKKHIESAKRQVLSRYFAQLPRGTMGEMGIIRGEIGRKRNHKPIRWVMQNAGRMVQRIKPVMLMSPISVAQFLPPGSVTFDLLVIDEASQVRPEEAIGVIARARQIVVVGDQKQLPPTSFFDRLVDDTDDEDEDKPIIGAKATDMESVLSLCEARGLPSRMLEWHYRSRDPSLICVSNAEFYDSRLILPPSPLQENESYGLKFRRVPGVYASRGSGLGRQGTNRIEAEAVVKAVAEHARSWPELSLGVVAFSKAQADLLTELLELERRSNPLLDDFLREERHESVFVKNIENVQGDERDIILISVGYGPQEPNGRLTSMRFGPVNSDGGERRLNVLFTRARMRCEVFASFDPGDIDLRRVTHEGPRILKRFLDFAKTGILDEKVVTNAQPDSPFEEDVASVIRSLGYLADPQVGSAGFRIDIGVRHPDHPGQYLLAVECDGATYHSALWARERDRLRQEVLENLGWRFHRIWSTDWFYHRTNEIKRLRGALEQALVAAKNGFRVYDTTNREELENQPKAKKKDVATPFNTDWGGGLTAPPYVRAELSVDYQLEPHEMPPAELAKLVERIVAQEGPIHIEEVARRVSSAFGKARTGHRILEATRKASHLACRMNATSLRESGSFLMTEEQVKNTPVRDRSKESGTLQKPQFLPPTEIRAAAQRIRFENGALSLEETIYGVARLLGFRRVGKALDAVIRDALATDALETMRQETFSGQDRRGGPQNPEPRMHGTTNSFERERGR